MIFHSSQKEIRESTEKIETKFGIIKQYSEIIHEQLKNNISEEVTDNLPSIGKTYYMPHQAVIREKTVQHRNLE